jgi:hypothetical protein
MSRWWANPEESLAILELVDDSNVEQGVGTAVLGYHGLTSGVLDSLSRRTLVDVASIRTALDSVDIEPVAKALGRATKPIMGDVSGRYGELLANNMHRQAVDATERLLLSLTNKGMAWPTAIERVQSVHGVPLERLGLAASRLGVPAIPPTVRADIGDRALMEYAAHMGLAENTSESISKASQEMFDPNEHPRGQKGRFVAAPARGEPVMDEEVMARRRRRRNRFDKFEAADRGNARREAAAERSQEIQVHQQGFLSAMKHAFGEPALAGETTTAVDELSGRRQARRQEIRNQARQAHRQPLQTEEKPVEEKKIKPAKRMQNRALDEGKFKDPKPNSDEYRVQAERFALVPKRVTDKLADGNNMSHARIEKESQDQIVWLSAERMQERLDSLDMATAYDYVVVAIDGDFATASSSKYDDEMLMAPSARLEASATNAESFDMYDYQQDFRVRGQMDNEFYDKDMPISMLVMHVRLENAKEYGSQYEDTQALPFDNPEVDKAYQFREAEVRRDAKGRFADEMKGGPVSDIDQVLARRQRRRRRFAAMDKPVARQMAANPHEVTLAQLAHATRETPAEEQGELLEPRDLLPSKTAQRRQARRQDVKDLRRSGAEGRRKNSSRNESAQAPDLSDRVVMAVPRSVWEAVEAENARRLDDMGGVAAGVLGEYGQQLQEYAQKAAMGRDALEKVASIKQDPIIPLGNIGSSRRRLYEHPEAADAEAGDILRAVRTDTNIFGAGVLDDLALKLQYADKAYATHREVKVGGRVMYESAIEVEMEAEEPMVFVHGTVDQITALASGESIMDFAYKEPEQWRATSLAEAAGVKPGQIDPVVTLVDLD